MIRAAGIFCAWLPLLMSAACVSGPTFTADDVSDAEVSQQNIDVRAADGREVDVRIFYPADGCDTCPLIIFSHGANATYDRYDVLLEAWARAGYIVAAPLHVDSEAHPKRGEYGREHHLPTRIDDFSASLDQLRSQSIEQIEGISISDNYIAAGHSFGALIAQIFGGAMVAGQSIDLTQSPSAVVAISPPGPVPGLVASTAWTSMNNPMLVVTGTDDIVPFVAPEWEDHLTSFEVAPLALAAALIFDGVDHYFNGAFGRIDEARAVTSPVGQLNTAIFAFIDQAHQGVPIADMILVERTAANVRFLTNVELDTR